MLIYFEGIDGSGKSTQIKRLAAALRENKKEIIETREPFDQILRDLLHQKGGDYLPLAQLLLFSASRVQHFATLIQPALGRGAMVLCDRGPDSTLAYQGYGQGLDRQTIANLNKIATRGVQADIIFLMDIPPRKMFERLSARGGSLSSYEKLGEGFFEKVRQGYLEIAANNKNYIVLDATQEPDALSEQIKGAVVHAT